MALKSETSPRYLGRRSARLARRELELGGDLRALQLPRLGRHVPPRTSLFPEIAFLMIFQDFLKFAQTVIFSWSLPPSFIRYIGPLMSPKSVTLLVGQFLQFSCGFGLLSFALGILFFGL